MSLVKGYTVHLRTNLDRAKMEHRWKQHKKRKAHKINSKVVIVKENF